MSASCIRRGGKQDKAMDENESGLPLMYISKISLTIGLSLGVELE